MCAHYSSGVLICVHLCVCECSAPGRQIDGCARAPIAGIAMSDAHVPSLAAAQANCTSEGADTVALGDAFLGIWAYFQVGTSHLALKFPPLASTLGHERARACARDPQSRMHACCLQLAPASFGPDRLSPWPNPLVTRLPILSYPIPSLPRPTIGTSLGQTRRCAPPREGTAGEGGRGEAAGSAAPHPSNPSPQPLNPQTQTSKPTPGDRGVRLRVPRRRRRDAHHVRRAAGRRRARADRGGAGLPV